MVVNQLIVKLKDTIVMEITKDKITEILAHPTNPVECCADANPKTMLPNDT